MSHEAPGNYCLEGEDWYPIHAEATHRIENDDYCDVDGVFRDKSEIVGAAMIAVHFALNIRDSNMGRMTIPVEEHTERFPRSLVRAIAKVSERSGLAFSAAKLIERLQVFVKKAVRS